MSDISTKSRECSPEAIELAKILVANLSSGPKPNPSSSADSANKAATYKLADDAEEQAFQQWRVAAGKLKDVPESLSSRQDLLDAVAGAFSADPELPERIWQANNWPRPFPLVLREEIKQSNIRRGRLFGGDHMISSGRPSDRVLDAYRLAVEQKLVGLAFSGGGIRSATFNLGVLQALAEFKVLDIFDYLSTVSGGGYIGAWFAGWLDRWQTENDGGIVAFQQLLSPASSPDPQKKDQKPIQFLRQFSNYLTPVLGAFSFDTWTMAAVYLRNVFLNQLMLIAGIGALLLLPRLYAHFFFGLLQKEQWNESWLPLAFAAALILLFSMALVAYNLTFAVSRTCPEDDQRVSTRSVAGPGPVQVQLTCLFPFLFSGILASAWFWININVPDLQSISWPWQHNFWSCSSFWPWSMLTFLLLSLVLSLGGGIQKCFRNRLMGSHKVWALLLAAGVAVACAFAGTALLSGYLSVMRAFASLEPDGGFWHAIILGPPLLLLVLVVAAMLHVGLLGVDLPDAAREWLSRFRAVGSIYAFYWLALFVASIYGPLIVCWLGAKSQLWVEGISATWVATTASSIFAAYSSKTGKTKEGAPSLSRLELLARIGPPIFFIGFVLALSTGEHFLLSYDILRGDHSFQTLVQSHWILMRNVHYSLGNNLPLAGVGPLFLTLVGAAVVLIWRVDINDFSMHHFYKNRLVRCYMGASHQKNREPNAFTGFDEADDLYLSALAPSHGYLGPYPIINTTLNLSAGDQLAWQERKAASFFFSPCFSGYNYTVDRKEEHSEPRAFESKLRFSAYRKTADYAYNKGIKLGTAMAISGAAANPNQGFSTSATVAFLMTVFDVRLGWWIGNPRNDRTSRLSSPVFGLAALISELLGRTDDRTRFVSLSDGGHFDNMGLYELIRRRCKFIVLCDAEQDADYKFGGLGMAIRRCRVDFGAEIDLNLSQIARAPDARFSAAHCAVGTVRYMDGSEGIFVYIKSTLTGDEPDDVLEYAKGQPAFPHQSTADQWFGESQFESYRKLGYHAAIQTFGAAIRKREGGQADSFITNLFANLRSSWYPVNPAVHQYAGKHTKAYSDLLETLRATPSLQSLGMQLFHPVDPPEEVAARNPVEEFYFSLAVIQLMEDIYFDLGLDEGQFQDDPRIAGWMTLFRSWKTVPAVAAAWLSSSSSFQRGFQSFWGSL